MNQEMGETLDGLDSFVVLVERNRYGFQNEFGGNERGMEKV